MRHHIWEAISKDLRTFQESLEHAWEKDRKIRNSGEIIFDAFAGLQNKSRASVKETKSGPIPQKHRNKCRSHRNLDMVYKLDSIS